jgi:hypothetical protein
MFDYPDRPSSSTSFYDYNHSNFHHQLHLNQLNLLPSLNTTNLPGSAPLRPPQGGALMNSNSNCSTTTTTTTNTATNNNIKNGSKTTYFNNVASIVCLLWFNDMNVLNQAFEDAKMGSYMGLNMPMSRYSIPSNAFKQFIVNVITRTQLPPTAVSLALLYILRLKKLAASPIVGSANSEYRVFSVALILANKYLDDNTYTNKTWSDITKLPLKELSAMEIEFLANIDYRLYVDQLEWRSWQRQLKVWLNIHYAVATNRVSKVVSGLPSPRITPPLKRPDRSPLRRTVDADDLSLGQKRVADYDDSSYVGYKRSKRDATTLLSNVNVSTPVQNMQTQGYSAPIYYVVSQRKTFSPHYGYLPSTQPAYLLPQQYQFELQHYIPVHNNPDTRQFFSPTTVPVSHWTSPPTHGGGYQR